MAHRLLDVQCGSQHEENEKYNTRNEQRTLTEWPWYGKQPGGLLLDLAGVIVHGL